MDEGWRFKKKREEEDRRGKLYESERNTWEETEKKGGMRKWNY